MSILTQSPSWFIPLCLVAGIAYAGALYFRDRFNRTYGWKLASLLGFLRFTVTTLIAFFLLKPIIRSTERVVEKPVIVLAQDNSQSLVTGKDSAFYRNVYREQLTALAQSFGEEYDVRTFTFGEAVREGTDSLKYDEKLTDMSLLLEELYTRFSGRNLGAVIIASDGLYNKGRNPVGISSRLNVPFYTIALGDTTIYKDLLIADLAVNRLAYLGNRFPAQITVEARKAIGSSSTLTVSRKGKVLYSEVIQPDEDLFIRDIPLTLDATEVGLQKYTVSLSPVSGEITTKNNVRDFFIDVLDSRQKILIVAQSPHPDIAAWKEALTANESYDTEAVLAKSFNGKPSDYSLVIFHQLPGINGVGSEVVKSFLGAKVPALFVWGSQTDFRAFSLLGTGFSLENYRPNNTDAGGQLADGFSLFTLSDQVRDIISAWPPLTVPFGDIEQSPGAVPFIQQRVGRIATSKPLIAFNRMGESRVGIVAGEGIWRWRLAAYQQFESHDVFNEFAVKTAQYLAAREDRSLFRVQGARNFQENEAVIFDAEVYNESYEPVTDREISMTIRNEQGEEFSYTFSPSGSRYRLNAGNLPVGNYTYSAVVSGAATMPRETGEFSVSPLQLESSETIADHRLMYQLAHTRDGEMVFAQDMNRLTDLIRNKKEVVSVSYENKELTDLINFKWLLALILLLLSLEWLLRKRAGTY